MTTQLKETYSALEKEKEALEQKERTVREGRQYLKTFLDTIPDLAWLLNHEGRYLAVNEALINTFDLIEENVVGQISYDLWPLKLAERFRAEDQAVIQSGQPKIIPEILNIQDQPLWFETIKTPVYNDSGEPIGIAGISRNVTFYKQTAELLERQVNERTAELARANADLRFNEARLEALLAMNQMAEASGSQIAGFALEKVVSLTKSRYGFLLFFNITGKVEHQYVWPPDAAGNIQLFASWATALWENAAPLQELIVCNECPQLPHPPNLATDMVELSRYLALAITENDRLVACVMVINKDEFYDGADAQQLSLLMTGMWNIRQRQRIRAQLFQSEKLASLGLLIAGVAHEINNPNSFIFFNLPILRDYLNLLAPIVDEYAALHPEFAPFSMPYEEFRRDLFQLLQNMEHGSSRINATVSLLKEFARGPDQTSKQWVNPRVVLEQGFNLCKSQLSKMTKQVEIDLPENLPDIFIFPQYLEQILVNLLINAGQAADKPEAWVRLKVGLNGERQNFLTIEVSDNGCGMGLEIQKRIFDPFFTTKPVHQGTGLGLSICHRLVEELGGEMEIESEVGQGSTFRVILPVVLRELTDAPSC
jgi:PAS domain S-box-containing protein